MKPKSSEANMSSEHHMNQMTAKARLLAIQLVANIDNLKELVKRKDYDSCSPHIKEIKAMIREMGKYLKSLREQIDPEKMNELP